MEFPRRPCALLVLILSYFTQLAICMNSGKINFREKEKQILDQILGPGRYDARIRPSGINGTGILCATHVQRTMAGRETEV
uniref:Glutamate gated chloride channel exon 3delta variant n=1 Tax=Bombyx mori TaxID=7091 RepID=V9P9L3_BOMMO|nr:glutamate gated chloride channel exon 3delta variant [Bombyx mori]